MLIVENLLPCTPNDSISRNLTQANHQRCSKIYLTKDVHRSMTYNSNKMFRKIKRSTTESMDWLVSARTSSAEAPTPNVTIFGDRVSKGVIKGK